MADAGMNVARLNFSHGTYEEQRLKIDAVKEVRKEKNIPLPILLDTKGPEFRIGTFKNGEKIKLSPGDIFTFTTEDVEGIKALCDIKTQRAFIIFTKLLPLQYE